MLLETLNADMIAALKHGEKLKLDTIRMLLSDIKYEKVAKEGNLTEQDIFTVIKRAMKKRVEAVEAFRNVGRTEAADREQQEHEILAAYLPQQLTGEELAIVIKNIIAELGAAGKKDFSRVMKEVMSRHKNLVSGDEVRTLVTRLLE